MLKFAVFTLVAVLSNVVGAEVYRCMVDGKATYSDRACGVDAKAMNIGQDASRGKMIAKTKLTIADKVFDACWEGYRRLALDPTAAKRLGQFAEVADDGFPYAYVTAVFTNKAGGPNRRFVRCKLNDDMTLDEVAAEGARMDFFRSQMD